MLRIIDENRIQSADFPIIVWRHFEKFEQKQQQVQDKTLEYKQNAAI
jgi:hypothetical protein